MSPCILWMGIFLSTLRHPQQRRGQPCCVPHPQGLERREKEGAQSYCSTQHLFLSGPPPVGLCGLIAPTTPALATWLLPLMSSMKGQEVTVPRLQADGRMQESHFKSFLLTYSVISALATHHSSRYHFKDAFSLPWGFSQVSGCLFFFLEDMLLISWAFPGLGEGAGSADKTASCLASLDLTLALEPGLSWASCSGLTPAESIPAPCWLLVASQTRLWSHVHSLGIWSSTVPGE